MHNKYNIAVIGSTGNVGREIIGILEEREFPVKNVAFLASSRSTGKTIEFRGSDVVVQDLSTFDFSDCDIALSSPGASVSAEFSPKAAAQGCIVIDNTSFFRTDENIPLVVPEVNPQDIDLYMNKNIIANPNCSTIQMLVALKPIHDLVGINRIVVSTYQAVSGAGQAGIAELENQSNDAGVEPEVFTKEIAFNALPHIDIFMDDGATKEEWKMKFETGRILDAGIAVHANCARIGVFNGHSEYINIETKRAFEMSDIEQALISAPGVSLCDGQDYTTPREAAGKDDVFVARLRRDNSVMNGVSLWCVADNLRKGAALNTVQIAEELIKRDIKNRPNKYPVFGLQ